MSNPPANSRKRRPFADPVAFTPYFSWKSPDPASTRGKEIVCEGVRLSDVAARFGTPTYLYSGAAIARAYDELDRGLGALPHTLCFAVKANANLSLLKHVAKLGSAFDIVSGGELAHLQRIGIPGGRIVFSGVGKTREEIREALRYRARPGNCAGLLLFNIESPAELDVLLEESARHVSRGGAIPCAAIRVNPDVRAGGHPHISTGHHEHKFGLDWMEARRLYLAHRDSKWMRWQGISAHIGSQIVSLEPFRRALGRLAGYVRELRREGIALRYLDFGGGLGVRYTDEKPASRKAYAQMVAETVRPLGMHLLLEPGRSIVAPAGVLLTRVIYTKQNRGKTFVIVDAAMNDLMRPALYGAVHSVTRVVQGRKEKRYAEQRADIVGPVCESGDRFLSDWPLGPVEPGDVLALWTVGAYGMSLASNYNARCRAAEVLVAARRCHLIRRRETRHDLLRTDVLG